MLTLKRLVTTAIVLMTIVGILILGYLGFRDKLGESIVLPLLAIAGVVCLLLALTLTSRDRFL